MTVKHWTRDQLLVAFTLYSQIPFGKLHSRNPEIIRYAKLIGRTPSALAMKLVNIASLDPYITESGRTGLKGASNADRALWLEMNQHTELFEQDCQRAMANLQENAPYRVHDETADYSGKVRRVPIDTRVGQQLFRKRVLSAYEYRCCLTGLEEPLLLIASHILPWGEDVENRLNPSNGLCLSNLHDRAFDKGLITFNQNLEMVLSLRLKKLTSSINEENFLKYEGRPLRLPIQFLPDEKFLSYHRDNIFIGERG